MPRAGPRSVVARHRAQRGHRLRNARDGRNIERVGYYNPVASGADKRLELDVAKVQAWVAKGAQLTDKVRALVKEAGKLAA